MSNDVITLELIMTPVPLEVAIPTSTIFNIANQMSSRGKAAIVILENTESRRPVGIITERDIVRRIVARNKDPKNTRASEVMTEPVISAGPEASIYDASSIMTRHNIRRLPITRKNVLLGIVTVTDLSKHIYEKNKWEFLRAMSRYKSTQPHP